jgi:quercetin dioxygenase-like cupin family protein
MSHVVVTPVAEIEELGVIAVQASPGEVGASAHRRAHRSEAIFVLEGELEIRLGGAQHRLGRETWAFVPAAVECSLAVGDEPARFLVLHVPSSGRDTEPVIRRAGGSEGEKITDRPGRRATVLVDADDLIVSEFAYGAGERGAAPHVHHDHGDAFLVVEGEFTFTTRDGPVAASAGTFVLIPRDVAHGFDNDSDAPARCFNFHMPSSGFGDYLRGRNPGFDQHDPPADDVETSSVVVARLPQ